MKSKLFYTIAHDTPPNHLIDQNILPNTIKKYYKITACKLKSSTIFFH